MYTKVNGTEEWLASQAAAEILDFDAEKGKLNWWKSDLNKNNFKAGKPWR